MLLSVALGLIPEVLYFTLFMTFSKSLTRHRIAMFLLLAVCYFPLILAFNYRIVFYVGFIFSIYPIVKLLYQRTAYLLDIFVFSIALIYLILTSFLCSYFIPNYWFAMLAHRILLFVPVIVLRCRLATAYRKYKSMWNRNTDSKLKSITVRNISLIMINSAIVITNVIILYATSKGGG